MRTIEIAVRTPALGTNLRKFAGAAGLGLAAAICALQFMPLGIEHSPRSDPERSFFRAVDVPPDVAGILERSCMDCHSNQTRWPWYSRVAPVSLLVARDVSDGRSIMNFSEWRTNKPEVSASLVAAIGASVKSGRMPKPQYLLMHPDARLTDAERLRIGEWTGGEVRRLMALARARKRQATQPSRRAQAPAAPARKVLPG